MATEKSQVKYDKRLTLPLDFVCRILEVAREDLASLAISDLLDEELDWIKHNGFNADPREITNHKRSVKAVKFEANVWVINKK